MMEEKDELLKNFDYDRETEALYKILDQEEWKKVLSYEYCEIGGDFFGFLHSYKDLASVLPKNMTIIDIGACQGVQGEYFREFAEYIAVEPYVPKEYIYTMPNSLAFTMTGEGFIQELLPELQKQGLDLNRTFCVCSYVPDDYLRDKLIPETFPYYRTTYAALETKQVLPPMYREKRHADMER